MPTALKNIWGIIMLKIKKRLSKKNFIEMYEIERYYYSEEFITPAEESYLWYKFKANSICAIADNGIIVGFMNLFPISEEIYNQIKRGVYQDSKMTYKEILEPDESEGPIYLFLSCVAVHQQYRKSKALEMMLEDYIKQYEAWLLKGYSIHGIVTENVTQAGLKFSLKMGMKNINISDHNSYICEGTFENFKEQFIKIYGK